MQEYYHKWFSQYIGKEFEMLVFGSSGIPVVYFPPAKEKYYTAKDNELVTSVKNFLDSGKIKLYCPDTYDSESWYNFSAEPHERVLGYKNFEQLIIHDIIGFAKYETHEERIILAGSEFGGYHALNFALKHPDMVSGLLSLSGFFDIRQFIFGYYDNDCYFNNPPDYLPGLTDDWYLNHLKNMNIYFGCSEADYSLEESRYISSLLLSKGINCHLEISGLYPGWDLWKVFLNNFIELLVKNGK